MARPKAVNLKTFPLYNKLHTTKIKMYSGVEITALYPIKETKHYYVSPEVWAFCASKFKKKKHTLKLKVDIPVITDKKVIDFLHEHAWYDWVQREIDSKNTDIIEAIELLNKIFPNKEKVFFYELQSIVSAFSHGTFVRYNENLDIIAPYDNDISSRKYYTLKYFSGDTPELEIYKKKWVDEKDEKLQAKYLKNYKDAKREYVYKNNDLTSVFISIGENSVCYPVAFSDDTAKWYVKETGKKIDYAHAGEIFFVMTDDKIYFDINRHF